MIYILHYDKSGSKTMSSKDLECFPLLRYACRFWYIHARSIPVESRKSTDYIIFRLFLSDSAFGALLQVHRPDMGYRIPFDFPKDTYSPLHYASRIGLVAVVQLLLEHKADVNAKDEYKWTALHEAAWSGYDAVVRLLLEHRADINAKDDDGQTALHCAAAGKGHEAIVQPSKVGGLSDTADLPAHQ